MRACRSRSTPILGHEGSEPAPNAPGAQEGAFTMSVGRGESEGLQGLPSPTGPRDASVPAPQHPHPRSTRGQSPRRRTGIRHDIVGWEGVERGTAGPSPTRCERPGPAAVLPSSQRADAPGAQAQSEGPQERAPRDLTVSGPQQPLPPQRPRGAVGRADALGTLASATVTPYEGAERGTAEPSLSSPYLPSPMIVRRPFPPRVPPSPMTVLFRIF